MSDSLWPHGLQHTNFPVHHQLLELAQTHFHHVHDAIQPSHPLLSPSPPGLNLSQHRDLFQRVSSSYQVTFSFSISASNECLGLISFRIDCFDLFAAQRTLKSLLQHHSSKASILLRSAFFVVQLLHPYMTTGKNIALTIRINTNPYQTLWEKNRSSRITYKFIIKGQHYWDMNGRQGYTRKKEL